MSDEFRSLLIGIYTSKKKKNRLIKKLLRILLKRFQGMLVIFPLKALPYNCDNLGRLEMLLILLLLQNLKSEIGRCGVEVVWSNLRPVFADRAPTILQTFWSEWGNPGGEKYFSWNEKTFPKCKLNAVAQLYLLIFSAILLRCPSI